MNAEAVLDFWFREISPEERWGKDPAFDRELERKFGETLRAAERGELRHWRETPHGRLAEIIVLDQFSRNIYRGTADAFRNDPLALSLAQELVLLGLDRDLTTEERQFAYLPFMHSESLAVHETAQGLFSAKGLEEGLHYEKLHRDILVRFGRYPHRNKSLGRSSTPEETEFLRHHPGF